VSDPLRHMPRPCDPSPTSGACPFRRDDPGEFPADRYEELAATAGGPGAEAPIGAPLFACHHTADGAQVACAGWLAVCGHWHLGVRFALATGRLDPSAVEPQPGWPDLFDDYDEMAAAQSGQRGYDPRAATARRAATGHGAYILDKITGGGTCPL
jgi:hypothetical protein